MSVCQCCIILERLCGKSEALHALAARFTPSMQAGSNDVVYFSLNMHLHHLQVQQQRFEAEMKSHIPGTSEHKLKKQEENVHQDAKSMQKDEHKLQKQEAKQGAKEDKKLQKEENKLHKQEAKAADAADKAGSH